jgi:hypothetical protein
MPSRSEAVAIGFLILWMTAWAAAILVALWSLGAAALSGEPGAAVFLAVWVAAAGFGLFSAARRLRQRLLSETQPRRPNRNHQWRDGIDPPGPAP